jgi:hypothetical protein
MNQKEAIFGLSYGYRKNDPGPINLALAKVIEREKEINPELEIIAQWEIAACLKNKPTFIIKEHREKGKYLDTDEVIVQAVEYFKANNIKAIRLVAFPFLHRYLCRYFLKRIDPTLQVKIIKTGWIPFDKESEQFLAISPLHALIYAIGRILFNKKNY